MDSGGQPKRRVAQWRRSGAPGRARVRAEPASRTRITGDARGGLRRSGTIWRGGNDGWKGARPGDRWGTERRRGEELRTARVVSGRQALSGSGREKTLRREAGVSASQGSTQRARFINPGQSRGTPPSVDRKS